MTEPKEFRGTAARAPALGEPAGEPENPWPDLPAGLSQETGAQGRDQAVDGVLERLGALASTPVSGHGEAYEALHDELLKALNEDVAGQTPAGQGTAAPLQDHTSDRGTRHDDQA